MKISKYLGVNLSKQARVACDDAMAETARSLAYYDLQIAAVLANTAPSKSSHKFLHDLWHGDLFDQPLTTANRAVSAARTKAFVLALLEEAEKDPTAIEGPTRYRMLTNCPDLGVTLITGGALNPVAVGNNYDQAMRPPKLNMHGVNCLDVALMHDFGVWQPDWVSLHSHAIVRSFDPRFKPRLAAKKCCPKRAPKNRFGADVVNISSRSKKYHGLMRIAHLGRYVSKISCGTKFPVQGKHKRRTKTSHRYWQWPEALRSLEVYSHLGALSTMRGVGEGRALRARIKVLFELSLDVERLPYGAQIDHEQLTQQWARLYRELSLSYSAYMMA